MFSWHSRTAKYIISKTIFSRTANEITDEEFFTDSLVKLQYPNPIDDSYKDRNIKPFIAILQIIKKVNELCREKGIKEKGISKDEFGIFGLSILDYHMIDDYAKRIIDYRENKNFYSFILKKKKILLHLKSIIVIIYLKIYNYF